MVVAEPGTGAAALKLSQFFRYARADGERRALIWMPEQARVPDPSPWLPLLQQGHVQRQPLAQPSLLLLSDAADWLAADQLYGRGRSIPRLQLLCSGDLRSWGHGAAHRPGVRAALGESVAQTLRQGAVFSDPLHTLPIGLDPEDLPPAARSRREHEVLVLAAANPALGLAVQQSLRQRGLVCRCELTPWPLQQWQQALGEAVVAVVLAPAAGEASLGLHRLAAMALQTPLVCVARNPDDGLCRDTVNALLRPADPEALAAAAAQLLAPSGNALRRQLIDGGLATLVRHRRARERLAFEQLLDDLSEQWRQACLCHPETQATAALA